jgi:hypothetical protein
MSLASWLDRSFLSAERVCALVEDGLLAAVVAMEGVRESWGVVVSR